ncbi:hypothetical protein [Cardinium endosymbiont of Nabis limbatus]|uniref:hypothetical protein n=1 Tax=Cardinium endosymbiont of Nabis limbatus TaxID=3066217 RepID=UPI003AF3B564
MNKHLNNYIYKVVLLFAATLSINFTNKIVYCVLSFTVLMCTLNAIAKHHGSKKATISIVCCTTLTFGLLYNKPYCIIPGKPISGLILASLCAVLMASYIGFKLFLKLETRYGFVVSNCISLLIASLVDHLIMGIFFTNSFPMHRILLILFKETAYTYLFTSIIYLCSVAVSYAKPALMRLIKKILTAIGRYPAG